MAPTEVIDVPAESLTSEERQQLEADEETIRRAARGWLDSGVALERIRDQRLYRETHGSLEAYCRNKFGLGKQMVYRLIGAAAQYRAALPICNKLQIRFTAESQFRPLVKCQPETVARALKLVAKEITPDEHGDRIPTARLLAQAVRTLGERSTSGKAEGEETAAPAAGSAKPRANAAASTWGRFVASAALPTDGSDPGLWKGKPCPYAGELRAVEAVLEEAIKSLPQTERARRDLFALLTGRAVKLTQENEAPETDGAPFHENRRAPAARHSKRQAEEIVKYF
jgi:hypothetical protein